MRSRGDTGHTHEEIPTADILISGRVEMREKQYRVVREHSRRRQTKFRWLENTRVHKLSTELRWLLTPPMDIVDWKTRHSRMQNNRCSPPSRKESKRRAKASFASHSSEFRAGLHVVCALHRLGPFKSIDRPLLKHGNAIKERMHAHRLVIRH